MTEAEGGSIIKVDRARTWKRKLDNFKFACCSVIEGGYKDYEGTDQEHRRRRPRSAGLMYRVNNGYIGFKMIGVAESHVSGYRCHSTKKPAPMGSLKP